MSENRKFLARNGSDLSPELFRLLPGKQKKNAEILFFKENFTNKKKEFAEKKTGKKIKNTEVTGKICVNP